MKAKGRRMPVRMAARFKVRGMVEVDSEGDSEDHITLETLGDGEW